MLSSSLVGFMAALASVASLASAKDSRTFAVLRFHGDGPLTMGRTDPIVSPGQASSHVHLVQGGNAFGNSATGESLLTSTCSTANVAADKSAYWMPSLYFHDPKNGSFEPVPLFYMNVYYFFEATNDNIEPFPVGLQMVSGDAMKKTPPATGNDILDPSQGTIQPAQFTCPRSSYVPPSYPPGSNGTMAGIQDTGNQGAGAGFPFAECDGYASPLRADLHFPSCYDPSKALTDYKANTAFPTDAGDGKQDCPAGWVHMPHIFYEMYWNTPLFADRWTPNEGSQPFVLSNGDAAGYSLHGDFLAAWDTAVLQTIIDTCDAGDSGMDQCPGIETVLTGNCNIPNPTPEQIDGVLAKLPGNNPLFGWQYGTGEASSDSVTTTTTTSATSGSDNGSNSGSNSGGNGGSSGSSGNAAAAAASSAASPAALPATPAAGSASPKTTAAAAEAAAVGTSTPSPAPSPSSTAAEKGTSEPTPASEEAAAVSASPSSSAAPVSTSVPANSPATAEPSTSTSSPTTSSSSMAKTTPATTLSAHEEEATGCPPPDLVSTTVVTVPVTQYSTSTSTIYVTQSSPVPAAVSSVVVIARRDAHAHRHVHKRRF